MGLGYLTNNLSFAGWFIQPVPVVWFMLKLFGRACKPHPAKCFSQGIICLLSLIRAQRRHVFSQHSGLAGPRARRVAGPGNLILPGNG